MYLQNKSFENTVEKGEIAHYEQFLLFPQCFPPVRELSAIFMKFDIVVSKLFEFGRVLNLSFGKGLNANAFNLDWQKFCFLVNSPIGLPIQ